MSISLQEWNGQTRTATKSGTQCTSRIFGGKTFEPLHGQRVREIGQLCGSNSKCHHKREPNCHIFIAIFLPLMLCLAYPGWQRASGQTSHFQIVRLVNLDVVAWLNSYEKRLWHKQRRTKGRLGVGGEGDVSWGKKGHEMQKDARLFLSLVWYHVQRPSSHVPAHG